LHVLAAQCHFHGAARTKAAPGLADALAHADAALECDACDLHALLTQLHVLAALGEGERAADAAQRLAAAADVTLAQLLGAHAAAVDLPAAAFALSGATAEALSATQGQPEQVGDWRHDRLRGRSYSHARAAQGSVERCCDASFELHRTLTAHQQVLADGLRLLQHAQPSPAALGSSCESTPAPHALSATLQALQRHAARLQGVVRRGGAALAGASDQLHWLAAATARVALCAATCAPEGTRTPHAGAWDAACEVFGACAALPAAEGALKGAACDLLDAFLGVCSRAG